MRKFSVLLLLIPLVLLTGLYFSFSYINGSVCFKSPVCTQDIKTLCHTKSEKIWEMPFYIIPYYLIGFSDPPTPKIWQGPSLCSCGLDANTLKNRGWTECEVPENYTGKIQTRSSLVKLSSIQIPKTLPLFIVPTLSLSVGIGAIVILWTKRE